MSEILRGLFGKEPSEENPSEIEGEMNGEASAPAELNEKEKTADFAYLNSLYALFDGAIAQHLKPVIAQLNEEIDAAEQKQIDRDRILNLINIKQRLIHLTSHRWDKKHRDTITSLHQPILDSDARARQEAILAAWLSDNVLTIDEEARRYESGEGDGAGDSDLNELFKQLIAELDATTTDILTVLQLELIGGYREIIPYEPTLHELRYSQKIREGQRSEILVRGARFTLSETVLIQPTVQPVS